MYALDTSKILKKPIRIGFRYQPWPISFFGVIALERVGGEKNFIFSILPNFVMFWALTKI
jgi:hypothetical protein